MILPIDFVVVRFKSVSLCSHGCPDTDFVDQADLEFSETHLPLPLEYWNVHLHTQIHYFLIKKTGKSKHLLLNFQVLI